MKLYYANASPYSRKVRVMLAELGLVYEPFVVSLAEPQAEFARANPNLRIPCLVDGERALYESNVILEYLLETYGGSGSEGGAQPPLVRTLTRPAHHWEDLLALTTIETLLDSALNLYHLQRDGIQAEHSETMRRELRRIPSELDWLEAYAGPQGIVPGAFTVHDLNLTVTLLWMDFRKPMPWRGRANLEALVARHEGRPSFQATRPGG